MSLTEAVTLLESAAEIARHGHPRTARKVAEHAVMLLRELEPPRPEPVGDVLARALGNVVKGEG